MLDWKPAWFHIFGMHFLMYCSKYSVSQWCKCAHSSPFIHWTGKRSEFHRDRALMDRNSCQRTLGILWGSGRGRRHDWSRTSRGRWRSSKRLSRSSVHHCMVCEGRASPAASWWSTLCFSSLYSSSTAPWSYAPMRWPTSSSELPVIEAINGVGAAQTTRIIVKAS